MQISGSLPQHIARAYSVAAPVRPPAAPPATGLVGGRVDTPVEFDQTAAPSVPGALPLYVRAADRIEAAVSVQVGRSVDVKG